MAFAAKQQRPARRSRAVQPCRAMADEEERKLTFESNKRSVSMHKVQILRPQRSLRPSPAHPAPAPPPQALGFTESDSAGQTNIFAVEPKSYVAGSSSDNGSSTVVPAAGLGLVAIAFVAAGLQWVTGSTAVDLGPTGDFKALSEYKASFEAEARAGVKAPAAAPALAE